MSPVRPTGARHIASPLPSTGPNVGQQPVLRSDLRAGRRASSAVPSVESASTTSDLVDRAALAQGEHASTIGPIVAASSRAGRQTETVASRCAAMRSGGNCAWWKLRVSAQRAAALKVARLWRSVPATRTEAPWAGLLEAGREDGRLAARGAGGAAGRRSSRRCPDELHPRRARGAGAASGIDELYAAPGRGAAAPRGPGPTIVTTGTASGKSLCFNLPTLDVLCARRRRARALYLYPTKALAQDQARALHALGLPGRAAGDLRRRHAARGARARSARARTSILTNPDMLHVGILPQPPGVGRLLREPRGGRRRRGARLPRRVRLARRPTSCAACGASPTPTGPSRASCSRSATIANPVELAERLTGLEDFALVDRDGSPSADAPDRDVEPAADRRGARHARARRSREAAELLADLVQRGVRTICFIKSRKAVELITRFTPARLRRRGAPELAERVAPYRAGYTPAQRREIEARLDERRAARRRHHRRAGARHRHRARWTPRSA